MDHRNVLNPCSLKFTFDQYLCIFLVISLLFFLKNMFILICTLFNKVLLKFIYCCWRTLSIFSLCVNLRISKGQPLIYEFFCNIFWSYLLLLHVLIMWRENFVDYLCLLFDSRSNCSILDFSIFRFYRSWMKFLYDRIIIFLFVYNYLTSSWRKWILLNENRDRWWSTITRLKSLCFWLI